MNIHTLIAYAKKWVGFDIEENMFSEEYDKYQQDGLDMWLYYFIKLNNFPSIKSLNQYDRQTYHKLKRLYTRFQRDDFYIRLYSKLKYKDIKDIVSWMICTRGCQFYPEIFNGEFQRAVMRFVVGWITLIHWFNLINVSMFFFDSRV